MVARADLVIDAVAGAHHALPGREARAIEGAEAALAGELAFALGDDDLEAGLLARHGLAQGLHHCVHVIGGDGAQPLDPQPLECGADGLARRLVAVARK